MTDPIVTQTKASLAATLKAFVDAARALEGKEVHIVGLSSWEGYSGTLVKVNEESMKVTIKIKSKEFDTSILGLREGPFPKAKK